MTKEISYNDISPETWAEVEHVVRKKLVELMDFPEARIVKVELFDPGSDLPGRTGLHVQFEPALSEEERKRFQGALVLLSRMYGGRDPICAAKV